MAGYGKYGNLRERLAQTTGVNLDDLPKYIRDQISVQSQTDEGGKTQSSYGTGDNAFGSFKDSQGRDVVQIGDNPRTSGDAGVKDPSKVWNDPDLGPVTTPDNMIDTGIGGPNYAMILAALTMGAGGTLAGLGAAGGLGEAGAAGAGLGAGEAAAGAGASLAPLEGVSLGAAPTFAVPGELATGAGAGGGLAGLGAAGGAGGAGAGAGAGAGLTPLTGVTLAPETSIGSMATYGGGAGSSLLSGLTSNPAGLARAGLGFAALGGSQNAKPASGSTDAGSIIDQMAQANRVNQNTPIGSRAWSKDPNTGQWTVNDTMSPTEQANFTNVQGLNAGMTDSARQALARMLAAPSRSPADSAFTINGRTIGG